MAQQAIKGYTVTGAGEFPMDMLRYDRAWPARGQDVTAIIGIGVRRGARAPGRRSVRLHSIEDPTEGRWASFGWAVEYYDEPSSV